MGLIEYDNIRQLLIEGNTLTVYGIDRLIPIIRNINELKLNTLTIQQGYEENIFSDSGDVYYITSDDTMFDFTDSDWNKAWNDALNYEINWLQSEREEGQ